MSDWKPSLKGLQNIIDQNVVVNSIVIEISAELTESMLGTVPKDKKIYESYVASKIDKQKGYTEKEKKQLSQQELDTVEEELLERGWTGFHRDKDGIFIYNYMILGNIKANIQLLNNNGSIKKVTTFKKACDTCIKVTPRKIRFKRGKKPIVDPDASMERPLRAMTALGERTFISKSDLVETGAQFDFRIRLIKNLSNLLPQVLMKSLKTGELYGLGQWRGSGNHGSYKITSVKILKEK